MLCVSVCPLLALWLGLADEKGRFAGAIMVLWGWLAGDRDRGSERALCRDGKRRTEQRKEMYLLFGCSHRVIIHAISPKMYIIHIYVGERYCLSTVTSQMLCQTSPVNVN